MHKSSLTRRAFLTTVGQGVCAAAIVAPLAGSTATAAPKQMQPMTLDLARPEYEALARAGGAVKVPNPLNKKKPIIVIRVSDTEAVAYSSKCTHLGCELPLPIDGIMTCPCHKAQFDATGNAIKGPAKKPLQKFAVALGENSLTISGPESKK